MLISIKVRDHLTKKMEECQSKLNLLERKRRTIKNFHIAIILLSIFTSALVTIISSVTIPGLPIIVIPIISATGTILTAISARFNFGGKKSEMKTTIEKLYKIKHKLEYVVNCNGDLSDIEYDEILKSF